MAQPNNTPTSRTNRRRARRLPAKNSTKVCCFPNSMGLGTNIASTVLDLSETGIRLLVTIELKVGQEVEVALEGVFSGNAKRIAVVVWVVPAADGTFCVGAQFQKALPFQMVGNLARE